MKIGQAINVKATAGNAAMAFAGMLGMRILGAEPVVAAAAVIIGGIAIEAVEQWQADRRVTPGAWSMGKWVEVAAFPVISIGMAVT